MIISLYTLFVMHKSWKGPPLKAVFLGNHYIIYIFEFVFKTIVFKQHLLEEIVNIQVIEFLIMYVMSIEIKIEA